jgi:protein O-mannosyl-transferase
LAFVQYFESIQFGYVLDDVIILSENSFVQNGFAGIWDILSKESFTGYFGEQKDLVAGSRYRPLSIVSFAIEFEFFGNNPAISHFINILLYALTGCVIFRLATLLITKEPQARWWWSIPFISALLFVAHPIHSEAVANIKGRDEIMCLLFSISATISWLRYFDTNKKHHLVFSCLWFLLGLFSKENAVTFMAVIPLTIHLMRSVTLKQSIFSAWPLWLCCLFFIMVRWQVIGYFLSSGTVITDLMNNPFVGMKPYEKIATIFYTIGWYYKLLFVPHPLTHDYYPYHVPKVNFSDVWVWISIITTLAFIVIAYRLRKKQALITYAIAYYFITFSIVSNFLFPVGTFMNERFIFMPSVGFSLLCGYYLYGFSRHQEQKWKFHAWLIFILLIVAYSFQTITRVPDWKDGFTLNLSAVKVSKNSARINLFTGVSYFQRHQTETNPEKKYKDLQTAEYYIDRALAIFPTYGHGLNMKAGILAEWLKKDNDIHRFLKSLESIIKIKPELDFVTKYMEYLTKDPENNPIMFPYLKKVGYDILYKQTRNYVYALHFLGMAHRMNDKDADLCFYIASVYRDAAKFGRLKPAKMKEFEQNAELFFNQAATLDPKYAR